VDGSPIPLTLYDIMKIIVNTGCHESGHMLGLVSETYLGGMNGHHNPGKFSAGSIMNDWNSLPYRLEVGGRTMTFNAINSAYLVWLSPKP